jgi:hypothetical protein
MNRQTWLNRQKEVNIGEFNRQRLQLACQGFLATFVITDPKSRTATMHASQQPEQDPLLDSHRLPINRSFATAGNLRRELEAYHTASIRACRTNSLTRL